MLAAARAGENCGAPPEVSGERTEVFPSEGLSGEPRAPAAALVPRLGLVAAAVLLGGAREPITGGLVEAEATVAPRVRRVPDAVRPPAAVLASVARLIGALVAPLAGARRVAVAAAAPLVDKAPGTSAVAVVARRKVDIAETRPSGAVAPLRPLRVRGAEAAPLRARGLVRVLALLREAASAADELEEAASAPAAELRGEPPLRLTAPAVTVVAAEP